MTRAKIKGKQKVQVSAKQLERVKEEVAREMTGKVALIVMAAICDEMEDQIIAFDKQMKDLKIGAERGEKIKGIFRFDEEMLCNLATRVDRYASHIDKHIVDINLISQTIKKHTGIEFSGW